MVTVVDDLNISRGLLGLAEDPPGSNHNFITDWYADRINNPGFAHAPWCAMSRTYCYCMAGGDLSYAYVPYIEADAKAGRNGLVWLGMSAEVGAWVIIDFNRDGVADHVGQVEAVNGDGSIITLEGNIGDAYRRQRRDMKYVRGFVRVPHDDAPAPVVDPGPGETPTETGRAVMPNLAVGSRGRAVKILEQLVGASVDAGVGIFGPECKRKVTEFQRANGLPVTGRVDARMWWALMQAAFNYIVHTNLEVDGIPGPLSTGALIEFQRTSGIGVDGEAGYETFGTLTGQ